MYCIYLLKHENANIYIGATNNIKRRLIEHKNCCYNKSKKEHNQKKYIYIRSKIDKCCFYKDIIVQIIEENINKDDLLKTEQLYIDLLQIKTNGYNDRNCILSKKDRKIYHQNYYLKKKCLKKLKQQFFVMRR